MKYTILGAGAMGSLFGGKLAAAGHDVELLDINEAHLEQIRQHGLRLETDAGNRVVYPAVALPADARQMPDWLIVFTKTMHTETALQAVEHLLGSKTCVLSLQNGLGNLERLQACVPLDRIAIGVTTVPADMKGPGHVASHGWGTSKCMAADVASSDAKARVQQLVDDFNAAELETTVSADVMSDIWRKVAFNAALNTICAVTGATVGMLGRVPSSRELVHRASGEVIQVAQKQSIGIDADGVHRDLDDAMDHHLHHQPSMLQDLLAGRATEIDAIAGAVVRDGERLGIGTPVLRVMHALVRQKESQAAVTPTTRTIANTNSSTTATAAPITTTTHH
ncbi:ketopantoate reductase family protein [Hydrogenophaga sp. 5NK40-0174]|uniref:ketopantoate reductase family protein n=1 Tax=Hydrogenophaga sp. 5NK40-0174 TaxID=3127649 RepID=UPI0031072B72